MNTLLDLQVYLASCATGVLTALAVISDSKLQLYDRASPRIVAGGIAGGANIQYGRVHAPGLPAMDLFIPGALSNQVDFVDAEVSPREQLTVYGYQTSGGAAENVFLGLSIGYDQKIGKMPGKPCGQVLATTDGNNTWGALVAMTNLRQDKIYQIQWARVVGATSVAARFDSPSFRGLKPGVIQQGTAVLTEEPVYFPEDDLPTFSGQDGCSVQTMGTGAANTCVVYVGLIEVN